ncbi:MAG: phosphoenolpyruvate carboxykinase domain-containing protein [bacterium]
MFHIHGTAPDGTDTVFAIEVGAGDLISVPRDTTHWFDRCDDRPGLAVDSPLGAMPAPGALAAPDGVSAADLDELLAVDAAGWTAELDDVEAHHYPAFGDRLPGVLREELAAMRARLAGLSA